jgi:CRP-like cAMP-binding protein
MADLRKLKDKAAEHVAKGRFSKAAEVLAAVVKADKRDIASHQKLGEVLRRAGKTRDALLVYQDVADRYARDGQLVKAIAICKIILEVDPEHAETQAALADLYARKQAEGPARPRGREVAPPPEPAAAPEEPPAPAGDDQDRAVEIPLAPAGGAREIELPAEEAAPAPQQAEPELELSIEAEEPAPEAAAPPPPAAAAPPPSSAATPFEAILGAARERAAQDGEALVLAEADLDEPLFPPAGAAPKPAAVPPPAARPPSPAPTPAPGQPGRAAAELPRVPLFSDLPREAFVALAERVALHRLEAGAAIVSEGEQGTSFFVVASGSVRVEKRGPDGAPVPLARLGEGCFFGEMAILSGEPRAATVVAETDCEVLEIRADLLLDLAREHPKVVESLAQFYRRRLLANAMSASALFRPFGREDRAALMARFRTREVAAGTEVVAEGAPSDGLYVVLSGALDVWKRREGVPTLAGRLREGDVFGEMSCLRKGPASATVLANRRCLLLRLPRSSFDELVVTYPQILELVSELSDERHRGLEAIAAGQGAVAEDGSLLT